MPPDRGEEVGVGADSQRFGSTGPSALWVAEINLRFVCETEMDLIFLWGSKLSRVLCGGHA